VVLDNYSIIEENQTRTEYNWSQYFSPEELRRGFVIVGKKTQKR